MERTHENLGSANLVGGWGGRRVVYFTCFGVGKSRARKSVGNSTLQVRLHFPSEWGNALYEQVTTWTVTKQKWRQEWVSLGSANPPKAISFETWVCATWYLRWRLPSLSLVTPSSERLKQLRKIVPPPGQWRLWRNRIRYVAQAEMR